MRRSRKPLSGVTRIESSNLSLSAICILEHCQRNEELMNKVKTIFLWVFIPVFVLMAVTFLTIKNKREFQQKTILAQELRKVLENLMFDLSTARENTILDVPADGRWHNSITFIQGRQGTMEYLIKGNRLFRISNGRILMVADNIADLRIRRQKESVGILEVQIKAQKNVSLITNIKIRIH